MIQVSSSGAPMEGVNSPNVSVSKEAEDSLLVSRDDAMETDGGYPSDGFSDTCFTRDSRCAQLLTMMS